MNDTIIDAIIRRRDEAQLIAAEMDALLASIGAADRSAPESLAGKPQAVSPARLTVKQRIAIVLRDRGPLQAYQVAEALGTTKGNTSPVLRKCDWFERVDEMAVRSPWRLTAAGQAAITNL